MKFRGHRGRSDLESKCWRPYQVLGIILDSTWRWFMLVPWVSSITLCITLVVRVIAAPYVIVGPIIFMLSPVGSMLTAIASTSIASSPTTVVTRLQDGTLAVFRVMVWGSIKSARWSSPRVLGHVGVSNRHIAGCWYAISNSHYQLLNSLNSLMPFFCGGLRHHRHFLHGLDNFWLDVRKHQSYMQNVIVSLPTSSHVLLLELTSEFPIFIY